MLYSQPIPTNRQKEIKVMLEEINDILGFAPNITIHDVHVTDDFFLQNGPDIIEVGREYREHGYALNQKTIIGGWDGKMVYLSRQLLEHWDRDVVFETLFHELAHKYVEIHHPKAKTHGRKFQQIMQKCRVPEQTARDWFGEHIYDYCSSIESTSPYGDLMEDLFQNSDKFEHDPDVLTVIIRKGPEFLREVLDLLAERLL